MNIKKLFSKSLDKNATPSTSTNSIDAAEEAMEEIEIEDQESGSESEARSEV